MAYPPKPARFAADAAPDGVEVKFVTFWAQRPMITGGHPRLQLVHTNAASGEGSIESAWNWSHAKPNSNTIPHYQIDRQPGRSGFIARKMLPSDRVGIANGTADYIPGPDVRTWSLAYETADLGYGAGKPGEACGFTPEQGEMVATILAYESVLHGIPLEYPVTWDGAGTASHTEPFGYPYWTTAKGKVCPGRQKKTDMRDWIMPRARGIAAAWTAPLPDPTPPPPTLIQEDEDMTFIAVRPDGATALVSHGGAGVVFTWVDGAGAYETKGVPVVHVTDDDFDRFAEQAKVSQERTVSLVPG